MISQASRPNFSAWEKHMASESVTANSESMRKKPTMPRHTWSNRMLLTRWSRTQKRRSHMCPYQSWPKTKIRCTWTGWAAWKAKRWRVVMIRRPILTSGSSRDGTRLLERISVSRASRRSQRWRKSLTLKKLLQKSIKNRKTESEHTKWRFKK